MARRTHDPRDLSRPRRRLLAAAGAGLLLAGGDLRAQRAGDAPMRVALVPYLSPRAMLGVYEPMRRHLEVQLKRPVEFFTARSFRALADSVRAGEQPLTLMPMHLARIAVADWGHVLVARSTLDSAVELIAMKRSALRGSAALRGRRIAVIDPLSITTLMLRRWLETERIADAVELVHTPSANAAAISLVRGEVDAMVVAVGQLNDTPGLDQRELEVLAQVGSVLTPAWVAQRTLPAAEIAALRQALLGFQAPGRASGAVAATLVEGSPRDLEPYEPYAELARRLLTTRS